MRVSVIRVLKRLFGPQRLEQGAEETVWTSEA
jgi:hypothetical protein